MAVDGNTSALGSRKKLTARSASLVRVLILTMGLVNGILVSRGLGPVGRGSVQLLLTVASLLVVVAGLSGELGYSRSIVARPAVRQQLLSACLITPLALGLTVVAMAGLGFYFLDLPRRLFQSDAALWVALLAIPLMIASAWTQRALLIGGKFYTACIGPTINALIVLGCSLVWLISHEMTVLRILTGFWAGALAEYCFYLLCLRSDLRNFSVVVARQLLSAGVRFYPSQLGLVLMLRVDTLVLAAFHGPSAVGIYAVAISVASPLGVLASTVSNTYMNRQYSLDRARAIGSTQLLVRNLAIVVLIFAVVVGALSVVAIPVLWGSEFRQAVLPTLLLLAGAVPMAVQRPIGQFLVREGLAGATTTRTFVGLGVAVLACLLLVPPFGPIGAALGADLAAITYALTSVMFFRKAVGSRWRSVFARPSSPARCESSVKE